MFFKRSNLSVRQLDGGLALAFLLCAMAVGGCSAPPLLEQHPSSVPLIEKQGDLVLEGAMGVGHDFAPSGVPVPTGDAGSIQGHLTWAALPHTAIRVGGSSGGRVEIADSTAHNPDADSTSDDFYTQKRSELERDVAAGFFFSSEDNRRVTELYIGRVSGTAAGDFSGAPCSNNCNSFSGHNIVYGDYSRTYLDLNSAWRLGAGKPFIVGFAGRLAQYDPYNMRDVNGVRVDAHQRTNLEPSIFGGFRVGGFQMTAQYADAIELSGGANSNYEFESGVVSIRFQWRID